MHVFYKPDIREGLLELDPEESRHCVKVLRMGPGDEVMITNGAGMSFRAVLAEAHPKACLVEVPAEGIASPGRPFSLHLAVAPTKNIDRFEWLLEKATECGVDQITPILCDNSERTVVKPERLEKILVAAMKQSQRSWLPILNPAQSLKSFLSIPFAGKKVVAHCAPGKKKRLEDCYAKGEDVLMLIGPEGDFSPEEIEYTMNKGFHAITIGDYRLRTETAALTLCIQANTLNGLL